MIIDYFVERKQDLEVKEGEDPDIIDWVSLILNSNMDELTRGLDNSMLKPLIVRKIDRIKQEIYYHKLHVEQQCWINLSQNPNAIHLLEQNLDKISWSTLSQNPNAIHLLEQNLDKVNWWNLCENPNAIHLLERYPDKIAWHLIPKNPNAMHLLEQNLDKISWSALSQNPNAIHLLEQNPDKIDWNGLSLNTNAIALLEKNKDLVWNTGAHFLGSRVCSLYEVMSANPAIFICEYKCK